MVNYIIEHNTPNVIRVTGHDGMSCGTYFHMNDGSIEAGDHSTFQYADLPLSVQAAMVLMFSRMHSIEGMAKQMEYLSKQFPTVVNEE